MAMRTYAELSQQAWLCAHYARTSRHNLVAKELWMIAQEYQRGAADKNGGIAPHIGEPPSAQTNLAWISAPERKRRTRELARAIWEREGRPAGQAERHWQVAEKTVDAIEYGEAEV
jgi:Protein of unknown function (DUF2934)